MAVTEGKHPGEFIISEGNGNYSRDNIIVASGAGVLVAGTVLGKLTAGGKYVVSPATGADGSQNGSAILLYGIDATSADVPVAAIARDAEVNGNLLTYAASVNDGAKRAAKNAELATNSGIIVR